MRFVGQAFEVAVELDAENLDALTSEDLRRLFAEEHHRVFMHGGDAANPIELVAFRLGVTAPLEHIPALKEDSGEEAGPVIPWTMYEHGATHQGTSGHRASLKAGENLAGPVLLEDSTSTISIPPGWSASTDEHHNLILRRD